MKDKFYIDAGKRIREIREKHHYTREYVAMCTGISPKFLYEIEHGSKGFSADTLHKLSKLLDVSSEYILNGRDIKQNEDVIEILSRFTDDQIKELVTIIKIINSMF